MSLAEEHQKAIQQRLHSMVASPSYRRPPGWVSIDGIRNGTDKVLSRVDANGRTIMFVAAGDGSGLVAVVFARLDPGGHPAKITSAVALPPSRLPELAAALVVAGEASDKAA